MFIEKGGSRLMHKKYVTLIISCIILLVIFGCNSVVEEKADALTKIEHKEERWKQSPLFEAGGYTMIGEEGRLGFIYDDSEVLKFYPNKTQKYMWHFWGDEEELDGRFKVIATNQDDGEQVLLTETVHLTGPINEADSSHHTHMSLPKIGMWKMDAYIDDKLFGTIYVEAHKE